MKSAPLMRRFLLAASCLCLLTALSGTATAGFSDLLVTNLSGQSNSVLQFNPITGAPLAPATFAGSPDLLFPRGITVGPNNNVYINDLTGKIAQFNGTTGALINSISTGNTTMWGMAFSPNNGNLFVTNQSTNQVLQYTPGLVSQALTVSGADPLNGPTAVAFDGTGRMFVVNSGNNSVNGYTIAGSTATEFAHITAGTLNQPAGIAIGGGRIYVGNGATGANTIVMYDATTFALIGTITSPLLNTVGGLAYGFDNKLYAVSNGNNSVVKFNPDGTGGATLVSGAGGLGAPIFLSVPASVVPEPSSLLLVSLGGVGLVVAARRRRDA